MQLPLVVMVYVLDESGQRFYRRIGYIKRTSRFSRCLESTFIDLVGSYTYAEAGKAGFDYTSDIRICYVIALGLSLQRYVHLPGIGLIGIPQMLF